MATGFFGKLPVSGDFVARGLPAGVQPVVDRWLTRVLAPCMNNPGLWPPDGLRALIAHADAPLALLVLPSRDAAGRAFPLAAVARAPAVGQGGIDLWAGQVLTVLQAAGLGGMDADRLAAALGQVPDPSGGKPLVPPLLWAPAMPAQDPAAFVRAMTGI
ncbi:type VI secretion system protein ImpM [Paracoccus alcaliphilus]|uniref:Type VI secretion system protein ImpM n=1 Tax=Paracoccus alcaliphilus TaxID=34002 RepID=A0A1H8EH60_9RHOB|nr:type VI secretion system-associated protein TagF [Paracoccus alcaliphilus]WCR20957.1 type VI secretion system-associated protein TagF [Paracoccus alcaliphilus]SEN18207.1 type VI secretion system protein ImpM [Paracoccus alcaliphilus]